MDLADMNIDANSIKRIIDNWIIGKNAERNRKITYRRLVDGITYEKLAEEFELSVCQIQRILKKTESVVFKHIEK